MAPTLYEELGVPRTVSTAELRIAFKKKALQVHPDKGGSKEAFHRVMLALEVLSNPVRRKRYNARLDGDTGKCHQRSTCRGSSAAGASAACPASDAAAPDCRHGKRRRRAQDGPAPAAKAAPPPEQHADAHSESEPAPQPPQAPHTATDGGKAARHLQLLQRVYCLLQRLPVSERRRVLEVELSQQQRLELEAFILRQRTASGSAAPRGDLVQSSAGVDDVSSLSSCSSSEGEPVGLCGSDDEPPRQGLPWDRAEGRRTPSLCDADCDADSGRSCHSSSDEAQEVPALGCRGAAEAGGAPCCGPEEGLADQDLLAEKGYKSSKGRSTVRGLMVLTRPNRLTLYNASQCVESVRVSSKRVGDLSLALDHLLVLMEIKERFLQNPGLDFAARFRAAVSQTLAEHRTSMGELGLGFSMQVSMAAWIGRTQLTTPLVHDVDAILKTVEQLAPYHGYLGHRRGAATIAQMGPLEMEAYWATFRTHYLDACCTAGEGRQQLDALLEARAEAHRPLRELQVRLWDQRRMACEERLQRRLECQERRQEHCARRAMAREDRLSRRLRPHWSTRTPDVFVDAAEARARLATLLECWGRRERRVRSQERRQKARELAREARLLAAQQRMRAKRARAERDSRWRAMNRRDLTMSEIMGRRWERGPGPG